MQKGLVLVWDTVEEQNGITWIMDKHKSLRRSDLHMILGRDYLALKCFNISQEKLKEVYGEKNVWTSVLSCYHNDPETR